MLKRKRKFKITLLGILIFLVSTCEIFSQVLGDFRSKQNGDWDDHNTWEYFNGTGWVNASNINGGIYPGQTGVTTNDVTIRNGNTVEIDTNINSPINSVTIGDEAGGIDTLIITDDSFINTTQFTIAYDGFLTWGGGGGGNHTLGLPANTSFVVESPNPNPSLELGTHHGIDENFSNCSNSKDIDIGGVKYSSCNGAGSALTFEEVNDGGGNLNINPTTSTSPICTNKNIQLSANPSGTELTDTPITYNWTVTPPSGATYTLTGENPIDTPTGFGEYTYQLTISNASGLTVTDSLIIDVEACKTVVTNRRITYRVNGGTAISTTPTISNEITDNVTIQGVRDSNNNEGEITFFNDNGNPTYIEIEILLSDVPYDTITVTSLVIGNPPAINLNNVSFTMGPTITGSAGNFDYLFTIVGITISSNQQLLLRYTTNVNGNNNNPCPTGGPCPIAIFGTEQ